MEDDDQKIRSVADSWIIVVTVFLVLQLTAVTFTFNNFVEKNTSGIIYFSLSAFAVIFMGISLAIFLAAKDPRMVRYDRTSLIDKGVVLVYASIITGSTTIAYGLYVMLQNILFSIFIFVLLTGFSSILYFGLYRRNIHGRTMNNDSTES